MKLIHEQEIRQRTAKTVLDWRNETIGEINDIDRDTSLEMVLYAEISLDESRNVLGRWINASRRAGATWADIGDTLGISRQAAQQRFKVDFTNLVEENEEAQSIITRTRVSAFNETRVMDEEGRNGRMLVGCGFLKMNFVQTNKIWEHRRIITFAETSQIDKMIEQGWTHVASWSPFHYFRRELAE